MSPDRSPAESSDPGGSGRRIGILTTDDALAITSWDGALASIIAAIISLILLGYYGFTHHFPDPTLKLLVFILLFTAAAVAVGLPIAFLRNDPARWGKQN